MAIDDVLQIVKYISPAGNEFTFEYESVSMEVSKKTSEFIFPEKDGAFIQDLGRSGRKFPFTLYFSGDDYLEMADSFMLALEERGIAKLEHPIYKNRDVVPTGSITRRDDLVNEINQSVFTVTFSESFKDITFPTSTTDAENSLSGSLDNYEETAAEKFADDIDTDDVLSRNVTKNTLDKGMTNFNKGVGGLVSQSTALFSQYDIILSSFESGIDNIASEANILSRQLIKIVRTPSRVETKMEFKTKVYSDMKDHYIDDYGKTTANQEDVFYSDKLYIDSVMAAICEGVLYSEFSNKNEVINNLNDLLEIYDEISEFEDDNIDDLGIVDTGETYDSLLDIVSKTAAYMISLSFDLPTEKKIILGEDTSLIPLVSELYGDLEKLETFILDNNLNVDEIENLPVGKEIVYYE